MIRLTLINQSEPGESVAVGFYNGEAKILQDGSCLRIEIPVIVQELHILTDVVSGLTSYKKYKRRMGGK